MVADGIGSLDNYLTGVIIRVRGGAMEYVNAGHPPVMVKRGADSSVRIYDFSDSEFTGGYLGIAELQNDYVMKIIPVDEGDTVLLYSDCLSCRSSALRRPGALRRGWSILFSMIFFDAPEQSSRMI